MARPQIVLFIACSILLASQALGQERTRTLQRAFDVYAEFEQFAGAALVMDGGQTLFRDGVGVLDLELGVDAEADHRFAIGSISKSFTAALAVKLALGGAFDLDASVASLWTGFGDPSGGAITVRHLLTHRSGLQHWGGIDGFLLDEGHRQHEPRELANRYAAAGLRFDPGTDEGYSSPGFLIAGIVMEEVTGRPFHDLLRDELFGPLGLESTVVDDGSILGGLAPDYRYDFVHARYIHAETRHPSTRFATGDLVSTVDDLARWANAMRGEFPEVLDEATLAVLHAPGAEGQAYGWNRDSSDEARPDRIFWHGGLVAGYRTHLLFDLDSQRTIVLLGNRRDISSTRISDGISAILGGESENPVRRDLMKEALEVSAKEGAEASVARVRTILRDEVDQFYEDPVAWLLAAVELRSDEAYDRALPLYRLWVEENPEHSYVSIARRHAFDCAIEASNRAAAEELVAELADDLDEEEAREYRARIDGLN